MSDRYRNNLSRRQFLQTTLAGPLVASVPVAPALSVGYDTSRRPELPAIKARWVWYPSRRVLPNTFVFFRKVFQLAGLVSGPVQGLVTANSRYNLYLNGHLVQRGPAPCDPRYWDLDPVDLAPYLKPGENVVAALVCYFGGGDGTYVPSTPLGLFNNAGFLFQAEIPINVGPVKLASDGSWKVQRARCWRAGGYQRWYLRSLQEEFDARKYPEGWETREFNDASWQQAQELPTAPDRPLVVELPEEGWHADWKLTQRTIPPLKEQLVHPKRVSGSGWVRWHLPPEEYFDCFATHAFTETFDAKVIAETPSSGLFPLKVAVSRGKASIVTFEFQEEVAGYILLRLRAAAGTQVYIPYVEAQAPNKLLLRTAPLLGEWVRVITRNGETSFLSFDFDAFRFLQLVIMGSEEPVEILEVGVQKRLYPYPHNPDLKTSDATINRALAGAINTVRITSQDTIMDNITRERQQYAGDLDHSKLASYYGFGEYRQAARMFLTFAQGQNDEGWFMDCWPAWDRCQRLWQKHLHLTRWGPLLDHALDFVIATNIYFLFTGDRGTLEELYPRFMKFHRFLAQHMAPGGLLPVTGWTWNSVWIDHHGYKTEIDKHAAFNIYYVGFLKEGIARIAEVLGDHATASSAREQAAQVANKVRTRYWSPSLNLFVDNLPRVRSDQEVRLHERTCSMALLYGLVPEGHEKRTLDILAGLPAGSFGPFFHSEEPRAEIGFSYPLNACWRLWALSRFGRDDAVVRDLRERWGNLKSLLMNNTFSELWEPRWSESSDVWCQNGPVVLYVLYGDVLGIRPIAPGFSKFDVRPQLGDLEWIEGTVYAPAGPIHLHCTRQSRRQSISLTVPAGLQAGLVFSEETTIRGLPSQTLPEKGPAARTRRWVLPRFAEERKWMIEVVRASAESD